MSVDLIYRASTRESALRQGEILTGVVQYKPKIENITTPESSSIPFQEIIHPYAIVVSQDCDLDGDYKARNDTQSDKNKSHKLLNSILLCEVDTARSIKDDKSREINSAEWNYIKTNRHERYHFFSSNYSRT